MGQRIIQGQVFGNFLRAGQQSFQALDLRVRDWQSLKLILELFKREQENLFFVFHSCHCDVRICGWILRTSSCSTLAFWISYCMPCCWKLSMDSLMRISAVFKSVSVSR